jgi:hypothetical protein
MGEKWPRNFAESGDFHVTFGFFYMPQSTTWDRRLYFPSEGRPAEDFFHPKNPTASAGFEPANLGTKGQHATGHRDYWTDVTTVLSLNKTGNVRTYYVTLRRVRATIVAGEKHNYYIF